MSFHARKRLGQHFLHDPAVIDKLIATIAPEPQDLMVEIGPGLGALTLPLLARLERLHAVEIDSQLADRIAAQTGSSGKLRVHRANALEFDFGRLAEGSHSLRVVGNLPYNISTPLLFRLLSFKALIKDMHLMLQKEVVDRMTATPGGKDYGRLTVMLSAWTEIESCFDIGPGAFKPPPKVRSSLARITVRDRARFEIRDQQQFARVVAHLFSMRRKTLGRALKGQLTPAQIEALEIDPRARPEVLEPAKFALLAQAAGDIQASR